MNVKIVIHALKALGVDTKEDDWLGYTCVRPPLKAVWMHKEFVRSLNLGMAGFTILHDLAEQMLLALPASERKGELTGEVEPQTIMFEKQPLEIKTPIRYILGFFGDERALYRLD